jgi:hypothetical protein
MINVVFGEFNEYRIDAVFLSSKLSLMKVKAIILDKNWDNKRIGSNLHPSNNKIPPHRKPTDEISKS